MARLNYETWIEDRPAGPREICRAHCPHHGPYTWVRFPGTDRYQGCWRCDRERRSRAQKRRDQIRRPPRPPHEGTPDSCSFCGHSPLPGRRRSWCSEHCVRLWQCATTSKIALRVLVEEMGRVCWECGTPTRQLEVDHRRPLWSLSDQERTELRWWLPYNLQLLCRACHRTKTSREAAWRARGEVPPTPEPVQQLTLTDQ